MTAHGKEDRLTDIDFSRLTDEKETCVFLMGLRHVREVAENLICAGRSEDTPAAVISHATTAEQRTCIGTLSDIAAKVEREALTSPAIIVVGEVVTLAGKLGGNRTFPGYAGESENDLREMPEQLCDRQQMADITCQRSVGTDVTEKTLIVPYIKGLDSTRKSLAKQLREAGAAVCEIPVGEIRICPFELPHTILGTSSSEEAQGSQPQADMPDWMIFTSRNAVEGFFLQLREKEIDVRLLARTQIAAVGEQTVAQLKNYGLVADFVPSLSNAAALGTELSSITGQSASVWYIRGKDGGRGIAEAFRGNPNYREVIVYENCEIAFDRQTVEEIRTQLSRAAGIFFTSASCVRRICLIAEELPNEIYSIGPSCTKQLQEMGFTDIRQAEHTSYESLVQSYSKHHIPSDHEGQ
jgi:uroporphyrinogen III methyltransferase/synthase